MPIATKQHSHGTLVSASNAIWISELHMQESPLNTYLDSNQQAWLAQKGILPLEVRMMLADRLNRELLACSAYIPSFLLRTQLENPQPARISGLSLQGSIVYADLSAFTTLCDKLSVLGTQGAEEVSAIINNLFDKLITEVLSCNGELLKFGGDSLTAFFDASVFGESHATAATMASLQMQQRMKECTAVETRVGTFQLSLRVGVHSGRFFAAEVGDTSHIELVVTGAEINRVAFAQNSAQPGEVVISEQTAQLLDGATLGQTAQTGFYTVQEIAPITLPSIPALRCFDVHYDMNSLTRVAYQIEALRPYLMHDLPRRYLENKTDVGEFRPVSILFANFYDFSTLLTYAGDDAMFAASLLNAYFHRVQSVIHRYGGIVNKIDLYTRGDKLMALFGAPSVYEDDPLRAVRCALELQSTLPQTHNDIANLLHDQKPQVLESGASRPSISPDSLLLKQRIGINTDKVFAGRVGGAGRYEYTVMGQAVNLAARLMESTDEGTVLISPTIRSAVERYVVVQEQAPLHVKGVEKPVVPARVIDEDQAMALAADSRYSRFPLIGRDPELAFLLAEGRVALSDSGRTLVLVGDAGVGKSRLLDELVRSLVLASVMDDTTQSVPHFQIYTGTGESLTQSVPYSTLRAPLFHILGLNTRQIRAKEQLDDSTHLRLKQRVEKLAPEFSHFMPLLGNVLGIEIEQTPLTKSLDPEQRHNRVLDLIIAILLGSAGKEPLVLAIDDLHWADASSVELLARLAKQLTEVPLLLVVCYRPDPSMGEPWTNLATTRRLVLHELSREHSTAMLEAILKGPPPPEIIKLIERTQGNPFFIEELVHALVSSGTLATDDTGEWHLTCPPDQVLVPTSIEGLIMARIDRLDEPYQELVQVASVIGHRFQFQFLDGVYRDSSLLPDGLQQLMDADIIVIEEQQRELTYLFRHALLRDIAYESILYAKRRELHRRVAQRIEELYTGHLDEHLALLARHYLQAEEWEIAFHYHLAAGVYAQNRYANQEALALFAGGLDIAPNLSRPNRGGNGVIESHEQQKAKEQDIFQTLCPLFSAILQVAELYERSGYIYDRIGEYDKALVPYREALRLAERLNTEREKWTGEGMYFPIPHSQIVTTMVRLHRHLAAVHEHHTNYETAFDWLSRGMKIVTSESQVELARCYLMGSHIYYSQGDYDNALQWAEQGLSVAEGIGNTIDQAHALLMMGIVWRDRGEFDSSIPSLERARTLLDLMKDATRLSDALKNLGLAYYYVGRWQDAIKAFQKSLQISENVGDVLGMAYASNNLASLMLGRGEFKMAADLFQYSREHFGRIKSSLGLAINGCEQGELLLIQGQPLQALQLFRESILSFKRVKARNYLARVIRLAAEASLLLGDIDQAENYINQSFHISRELGMRVEEALNYRIMGQIALTTEDFGIANDYLEKSQTMLQKMNHRYEFGRVLLWRARHKQAVGDYDNALPYAKQAEHIFKELRAKHDMKQVVQLEEEIADVGNA